MTDNRTTELLPCPFCGGEADVMLSQSRWGQSYTIHHESVGKCPAGYVGSMQFATEAEAIAAWNTRADYHGYEQAAIEAWESIKAWNARAERTCRMETAEGCQNWNSCSECDADYYTDQPINYCPNCGARVVSE